MGNLKSQIYQLIQQARGTIPGVTGKGIGAANSICEQYFSIDVDTNNISMSPGYSLRHRALLATSSELPQNFKLRGKNNLSVRRPDGSGTQIADSWTALFTGNTNISNPLITSDIAWTGLQLSGNEYVQMITVLIGQAYPMQKAAL